ncbi:hypothetical protein AGOR_G00139420 [Albula goreensis]|uniref:Uncharacterized protein n=1 Tax=Albula goreensis TaxID=1534307 RepID=A0A8T3DAB0_9TELE|nr:hypothetical protein AGOR_G00139420 [Albula goreensis]
MLSNAMKRLSFFYTFFLCVTAYGWGYYDSPSPTPSPQRYWMTRSPQRYWMTTSPPPYWMWRNGWGYYDSPSPAPKIPGFAKPKIQVFVQADRSTSFQVRCLYHMRLDASSLRLDMEGLDAFTARDPDCSDRAVCHFNVTAIPPVSFTCVHEVLTRGTSMTLTSETFTVTDEDKHCSSEPSPAYLAFFSTIMASLAAMTAVVVMTIWKTRPQGLIHDTECNV